MAINILKPYKSKSKYASEACDGRFDNTLYNKQYKKDHPEKVLMYRLTGAKKLLEKHGYTVTDPAVCPWEKGATSNGKD